jgi:hypothetical protein
MAVPINSHLHKIKVAMNNFCAVLRSALKSTLIYYFIKVTEGLLQQ